MFIHMCFVHHKVRQIDMFCLILQVSLHLQNSLLYIFGIFLNAGGWMLGVWQSEEKGR